MNTLLLVGLLGVVGFFLAVPLFEFVFGTLLLAPLVKLLIARMLMVAGVAVAPGFADASLYVIAFAIVIVMAAYTFGRRQERLQN